MSNDDRKLLVIDAVGPAMARAILREARMAVLLDAIVAMPAQPPVPDVYALTRVMPEPEPIAALPGKRRKRKGCGRHKAGRWS